MKKLLFLSVVLLNCIFTFGQTEVTNNSQTEILQIPANKVVKYFEWYDNEHVDHNLMETVIDSIAHNDGIIVVFLTENKNYNSANILTNIDLYQEKIKDKNSLENLIMLFKAEFNKETKNSPIKPILKDHINKNGTVKWKISMEPTNRNETKLTFIFNSFDEKHKQNFVATFSKGIDDYFDYTIQEIYVTENFKSDIVKYLKNTFKSDSTDAPPMKIE